MPSVPASGQPVIITVADLSQRCHGVGLHGLLVMQTMVKQVAYVAVIVLALLVVAAASAWP